MNALEVISHKRDGGEHTPEEINFLLSGYLRGEVPDYQIAAWLMADVIPGVTRADTLTPSPALATRGEGLDLHPLSGVKGDQHPTGRVCGKGAMVASSF